MDISGRKPKSRTFFSASDRRRWNGRLEPRQSLSGAFPGAGASIWARRAEQSTALAREFEAEPFSVAAVSDLATAVTEADIITSATMAREPVLRGAWIKPGTHVDLIGAYKSDMREADDALISSGSLYVDSRETTIDHIGELTIPIASGVIAADAVMGDLYDLVHGRTSGRRSASPPRGPA
ncbi:hypothetical protein [Chelativorans xinjiangense]|uniref:hypothetical protein n=1 Tax=Chelativorans xinjiangense TaxID=2681485 RepID=UPI001915E8EF